MTTEARGLARSISSNTFRTSLLLATALLVLAGPTIAILASQTWSNDSGAQGPLILATGGWLLWRNQRDLRASPQGGRVSLAFVVLIPALFAYILGRMVDLITLEAAGLYGAGIAVFYSEFGSVVVIKNWFPLVYLSLAVPPPNYVVDQITAPLKQLASGAATHFLQFFSLPVFHQGVTIYVAQYQLLVEDACSGMNSLFGLVALSLFYVYLVRRSSWGYAVFLAAAAVPLAIAANVIRVIVLVLITYYLGNEVAQSFLHQLAGLFVFVCALLLLLGLDQAAFPVARRIST